MGSPEGDRAYAIKFFAEGETLERTTQTYRRQEEKMATCCSKQEEDLQTAEYLIVQTWVT